MPSSQKPPIEIGRPGENILALTFSGGGFETAMQLGVMHALLVSEGRAPDVVVGISAGAVNAAALAEILQAGNGLPPAEVRGAQVARFREYLDLFQTAPAAILRTIWPDPYEVERRRPLRPLELPSHPPAETLDRRLAVQERAGLVRLLNDLLSLEVPLGRVALFAHLGLKIAEAAELPWSPARRIWFFGQLWLRILPELPRLALPARRVFQALWRGPKPAQRRAAGDPRVDAEQARTATEAAIEAAEREESGEDAGHSIRRPELANRLTRTAKNAMGIASAVLLWLAAPAIALGAAAQNAWPKRRERARRFVWTLLGRMGFRRLPYRPGPTLPARRVTIRLVRALLDLYGVRNSLATPHRLRELLIRFFDPTYYGRVDVDAAQREAAGDPPTAGPCPPRKQLDRYLDSTPPIFVAPVAEDLTRGALGALPPGCRVVDALLAATALLPIFPPVPLDPSDDDERLSEDALARRHRSRLQAPPVAGPGRRSPARSIFVDGFNVANEPTSALMGILNERARPDAGEVHVYAVATLPVSGQNLADPDRKYPGLRSVVDRVLDLQRFRDARMEKRLTERYTDLLPPGRAKPLFEAAGGAADPAVRHFVRAHVHPIEPDRAPDIAARLGEARNPEDYRKIILAEVAKGCRAALEAMIQTSISPRSGPPGVESCRAAIRDRLGREPDLPGRSDRSGPGLAEVCSHCTLHQESEALHWLPARCANAWPVDRPSRPAAAEACEPAESEISAPASERTTDHSTFPAAWQGRPTVSLLLSGGVFRGVFQVGVLAGLAEAGLKPAIFAGASVGSIMAAMGARVFAPGPPGRSRDRLLSLAATFLALDRFILTDRFADFVRRFTLRAKATEISIADLDRTFRRYDAEGASSLRGESRRTVAGIERLLYISPFEQLKLLRIQRQKPAIRLAAALGDAVQNLLDRYGVGEEILGSESLAYLIAEHVLKGDDPLTPATTLADFSRDTGSALLAVATNLTAGRLDTLGRLHSTDTRLLEALLASSAFPAVFRPRWSTWLRPTSQELHRYTDGGVMDNLPLDSVVRYLDQLSLGHPDLVARRPLVEGRTVPHLVLCASLEPSTDPLDAGQAEELVGDWPLARKRATTVGYNRKIDEFAKAQRHFRTIWQANGARRDGAWEPLDIEVAAIKPRWLCGTFAFHPMLGFRRSEQARSIAHGCASTLATLDRLARDPLARGGGWLAGWRAGAFEGAVEEGAVRIANAEVKELRPKELRLALEPRSEVATEGNCWFRRDGHPCPFHFPKGAELRGSRRLAAQLGAIYEACGRRETHQSNEDRRRRG